VINGIEDNPLRRGAAAFLVVMNFRDRKVEVEAGEMIVVPKGVEHKPSSETGYKALLIEPEGVPNTGDVQSEITIGKVEWI